MSKKKRKHNNQNEEAAQAVEETAVSKEISAVSPDELAEAEKTPEAVSADEPKAEEAAAEPEQAPEAAEPQPEEIAPVDKPEKPMQSEKKKTKKKSSDGKKAEKGPASTDEGFVEHEITPSESKRLHERFKFDWELEDELIQALDEDASELTDSDEEQETPVQTETRTVSLGQAVQAIFGLLLIIFGVIGVIATGIKISEVVKDRNDNSEQIAYFEDFIMPLVASDAPIFDGASSLNEDVVIIAACWDIIFNPSVYYEYESGGYNVSYLDIDRRITKLFGPGLSYTHKTVGDTQLTFEYDEETGMYFIPAFPRSPAYYCDITDITEVDGGLELTVRYKLPITNWIKSVDTVEKTMLYTVKPSETDYNIVAIRIGEIGMSEAN